MTDAFRQSPVPPEQQGVNVVAFFAPFESSWRFSEVHGLVYGMKAHRFPSLALAVARRMGGSATGPYVDDFTTVDFIAACGPGQRFTNTVIQTMGGHLGPDKHKPTREQQVMLGAHVRMDTVLVDGMIFFEPRGDDPQDRRDGQVPSRQESVHASRGSQAPRDGELGGRQHVRQSPAPGIASLEDQAVPEGGHVQPGRAAPDAPAVPHRGPPAPRTAHRARHGPDIYSDASWPQWVAPEEAVRAGEPPRLGWIIFQPGADPRGFSMELGREFITALFPRKTQILAAEAVAVLAACVLTPGLIQGRGLVWFIDNEAALSSLIRGTSKAEDVGHIAACTYASGDARTLVLGVV